MDLSGCCVWIGLLVLFGWLSGLFACLNLLGLLTDRSVYMAEWRGRSYYIAHYRALQVMPIAQSMYVERTGGELTEHVTAQLEGIAKQLLYNKAMEQMKAKVEAAGKVWVSYTTEVGLGMANALSKADPVHVEIVRASIECWEALRPKRGGANRKAQTTKQLHARLDEQSRLIAEQAKQIELLLNNQRRGFDGPDAVQGNVPRVNPAQGDIIQGNVTQVNAAQVNTTQSNAAQVKDPEFCVVSFTDAPTPEQVDKDGSTQSAPTSLMGSTSSSPLGSAPNGIPNGEVKLDKPLGDAVQKEFLRTATADAILSKVHPDVIAALRKEAVERAKAEIPGWITAMGVAPTPEELEDVTQSYLNALLAGIVNVVL